jgi:hypothetical protein
MGFRIADCRLPIADWRAGRHSARAAIGAILCCVLSTVGSAAETEAERAERLKSMTAEQKEELLRKKARFDKLDGGEAERERLRTLHASIEASDNNTELQETLKRYHAWLGTLSPIDRDDIRDLPPEQRIPRIKELLKQQEMQRFQAFVGNLGDDDRQAIFKWLGEFVLAHEEEILEQLPNDERRRIRAMSDPEIKQRMLGFQMAAQRQNPKMPTPGSEDLNKLLASLTPETLAQIEQAPATEQPERVREMVRAAIFSRRIPPVSDEELRKFYTGLQADQRERLEGLEPEEFKRRLTWMYHAEKSGYRGGGGPGRWPGFGPSGRPGEGTRSEGPRGSGRGDSKRDEERRDGERRDDERRDNERGPPPGDRRPQGPPPEKKETANDVTPTNV